MQISIILWRGSLLPLGGVATQKVLSEKKASRVYDGYAAEREQAPSPRSVYLKTMYVPCSRLREQASSHRRSAADSRSVEFNLDSSSPKNSPPPAR